MCRPTPTIARRRPPHFRSKTTAKKSPHTMQKIKPVYFTWTMQPMIDAERRTPRRQGVTCGAGVSPARAAGTAAPQNSVLGRQCNCRPNDQAGSGPEQHDESGGAKQRQHVIDVQRLCKARQDRTAKHGRAGKQSKRP